jgi:hypothetical protein
MEIHSACQWLSKPRDSDSCQVHWPLTKKKYNFNGSIMRSRSCILGGFIHWKTGHYNMILVHEENSSYLFTTTTTSTLNWTIKVPRMNLLGWEVPIGLHKSRCAHREPSVDTVIGEVVRQVAFQECVYFEIIYISLTPRQRIVFKEKLTVSSERLVIRGGLLRRQSIPRVLHFQL